MEFEWNLAKEQANILKHGVSFERAVEAFRDPNGIKLVDRSHSKGEFRYYWVGKDLAGHILTARFTERGSKIRIFGCGYWRKYRRYYLEASKK